VVTSVCGDVCLSMANQTTYPCPCCGYLVFGDPPGSDDIYPICFWEDDVSQRRFPERGGANIPLIEAQQNYRMFGAIEPRFKRHVRQPRPDDKRDPEWRTIDMALDNFERPAPSVNYFGLHPGRLLDTGVQPQGSMSDRDYGYTYPADLEALYYWRENYWRKSS
jgi:hypothetical protein